MVCPGARLADFDDGLGLEVIQRHEEPRNEREKIGNDIGRRKKDDDGKRQRGEILLMRDSAVHRKDGVKAMRGRFGKQAAVPQPMPTHIPHGEDVVADDLEPEFVRQVFIEEELHAI